eukprot:evm.model.scf_1407.1 EVM.evm.TU.scf_1407.1   scf_1407:1527-6227(+)
MANSRYEYVKKFERDAVLLPQCWLVVRVDGKGFTRFSEAHGFNKPNDDRALELMDTAAKEVMLEFRDVRIAYGESDEYSFVFSKDTQLYGRRSFKIVSVVTSCFSGNYVKHWPHFFPSVELKYCPSFDGRVVEYPSKDVLRDYLSWRQADAHINNQGTQTDFKNELLFKEFGVNYAELPERYRKGSVVIWESRQEVVKSMPNGDPVRRERRFPTVQHVDIIRDEFWLQHPEILS